MWLTRRTGWRGYGVARLRGNEVSWVDNEIRQFCRMNRPLSLKRINPAVMCSEWSDGFSSCIQLSELRDACPCAYCTGEEILGQKVFVGIKTFTPGMNELVSLTPVGNYGVQAAWADGHDTGIYTWEMLRTVFTEKKLTDSDLAALTN